MRYCKSLNWAIVIVFLCVCPIMVYCGKKNNKQISLPSVPLPQVKSKCALYSPANNPVVPSTVIYAGEKVDFDRIDMYERLDRELTSLAYGHSNTLLTIKRANRYLPVMIPILKKYGIPEDFIYLAAIESYFNVRAYSSARAAGIWQFLASTAKQYGLEVNDEVDERYDPEKSTVAACKYLKVGYSKYEHWATVAASYNAGMGRISSELEKQLAENSFDLYLTDETSRYVFRIIAMKLIMETPKQYGFKLMKDQLYQDIKCKEITVNEAVPSWSDWAKNYGISYMQLKEVNPWIRSRSLTNKEKKAYIVKIPLEKELYRSKRDFKTYNKNWTIEQ
ncbi:MAG: lytic transglycosylase domain-containing protein [Muribaculaceae bacterium]